MPKGIPKSGFNKGWVKTDEIKKKIGDSLRREKSPWCGKHQKPESIAKMKETFKRTGILAGSNNPNWSGGSSYFVNQSLKRDNYTCRVCGLKDDEIMEVDHIKPKSIYPELKNDLNNLQTLCPNCHRRKFIREQGEILRVKKSKT